jgi:hypothetical protein
MLSVDRNSPGRPDGAGEFGDVAVIVRTPTSVGIMASPITGAKEAETPPVAREQALAGEEMRVAALETKDSMVRLATCTCSEEAGFAEPSDA